MTYVARPRRQVLRRGRGNSLDVSALSFPAPTSLNGAIRVPGDKSISHRAVLLASLARGTTVVRDCNRGEDVLASLSALRALGVTVTDDGAAISVVGEVDFRDPAAPLDCGNSGTTIRLLMGMLAARVSATLDGDASLRRRPMERVAAPLRAMGADVSCAPGGVPPVRMTRTTKTLKGLAYELPVASSQLKSALLLAGLRATGATTLTSPQRSRDHTELMLQAMGAAIEHGPQTVTIRPSTLRALGTYEVPGDISSAMYFIAAATRVPGSRISVIDTGVNPTRAAGLDIMRDMGAHIGIRSLRERHGEPSADIEVSHSGMLTNVAIDPSRVPDCIDELPLLCAVASTAAGTFVVRGASELRAKESDRIASTIALLRAFGVAVSELPDGISVRGGRPLRPPQRIGTGGDHRIGMTAAFLAAAAGAPIVIDEAECIATSYPGFAADWQAALGASAR
jgi:3-phosphoshikimate 1-carboxyvinyltransferase